MHESKLNESPNLLHWSKLSPNILHSLNSTSRKAVIVRLAMLKLHVANRHSEKTISERFTLEKSQPVNVQYSYSPLAMGVSLKFR